MDRVQLLQVGSADRQVSLLGTPANLLKVQAFPPFKKKYTRFLVVHGLLHAAIQKQSLVITGIRQAKDAKENEMADALMILVTDGYDWAEDVGNEDVATILNFDKHDLVTLAEEETIAKSRNVVITLRSILDEMNAEGYDVSEDKLNAVDRLIDEFETLHQKPKEAIGAKVVATKEIIEYLQELSNLTAGMRRNIKTKYGDTDPAFLALFEEAAKVGEPNYHITGATFRVVRGNQPLPHIILRNEEQPTKVAVSDIDGIAPMKRVKAQKNNVLVIENGVVLKQIQVDFKRGKMLDVTVEL